MLSSRRSVPAGEPGPPVGLQGVHRRLTVLQRGGHAWQIAFGRREDHCDRRHLLDGDKPSGVARTDQVADVGDPKADAAGDRRPDHRIAELRSGVVDRRLVAGDLRGELVDGRGLRVELLAAGDLLFRKLAQPLQNDLGIPQGRAVLLEFRLRLVERGLKRPLIEFDQQIVLPDERPFPIGDPRDLTRDLRPNLHGVQGFHGAKPVQVDGIAALSDRLRRDRNGFGVLFLFRILGWRGGRPDHAPSTVAEANQNGDRDQ